ncbi:uncharacterized protein LOC143025349 isoform X1 [Oratosquilla oratoria]|uniref:uncharacterized protein LOC143025349 isoform X1 n=1 Tax=Oratosquilla oratoria TaxID=337810 RepID=UPI003F761AB1
MFKRKAADEDPIGAIFTVKNEIDFDFPTEQASITIDEYFVTRFTILKILGVYNLTRSSDGKTYEVNKKSFVAAYLVWLAIPMLAFALGWVWEIYFHLGDSKDEIDNVLESSFYVFCISVIPAFQCYALKMITETLWVEMPRLRRIQNPTAALLDNMFLGRDGNMHFRDDASGFEGEDTAWSALAFYVPRIAVFLSIGVSLGLSIVGFARTVNVETMIAEWPTLAVLLAYLALPTLKTLLVVTFIQWVTQMYGELCRKFHNVTRKDWRPRDLRPFAKGVEEIQENFEYLKLGFIKYTLSVNLVMIAVFCIVATTKLLQNFSLIMYIVPLALSGANIALISDKSRALMSQYEMLLRRLTYFQQRPEPFPSPRSSLAEVNPTAEAAGPSGNFENALGKEKEEAVEQLKDRLQEYPPTVQLYGGFSVDYSILITVAGFVISYSMVVSDLGGSVQNAGAKNPVDNTTECVLRCYNMQP